LGGKPKEGVGASGGESGVNDFSSHMGGNSYYWCQTGIDLKLGLVGLWRCSLRCGKGRRNEIAVL